MKAITDFFKSQFYSSAGELNLLGKLLFALTIYILTKILVSLMEKGLQHFSARKLPKVPENKKVTIFSVLISVFKFTLYFIAITVVLNKFGINTNSIIATAGIGGIAIALGTQNLVRDVLSGSLFLLENQFNIGDYLTIGSLSGTVESIGLRLIKLRDASGATILMPNSTVQQVTNYSNAPIKADIQFPVPYETPLTEIQSIIEKISKECLAEVDFFTKAPMFFGIDALNEWNYIVTLTAEAQSGRQWEGMRLLRKKVLKEFQAREILPSSRFQPH